MLVINMYSFYIDIPKQINSISKKEVYDTLLYGFSDNNYTIINDIHKCDYIILHQCYFKFNDEIKFPKKTIIIDMSDSRELLTNIKCFLYFKRSCVDKKTLSFINYNKSIIPLAFPIKKSYVERVNNIKNLFTKIRGYDVCCTHLEIPDNHPCNLNVYRTKIVRLLKKIKQTKNYIFFMKYDNKNIKQARAGLNLEYFKILCNSKIIITCNPDCWEGDYRLFESLASGALVMCDKMITPVNNPLIHKKHIIYYDRENIKELENIIDYYMVNTEERKKIAKSGFEYAMKNHKYTDRILEIIEKVKENKIVS